MGDSDRRTLHITLAPGAIWWFLCAVVGVVVLFMLGGERERQQAETTGWLSVSNSRHSLVISNNSGKTIEDCSLVVNDSYWKHPVTIPLEGTDIWWTEFIRGNLRFDVNLERFERVHIMCANGKYDAVFSPTPPPQ